MCSYKDICFFITDGRRFLISIFNYKFINVLYLKFSGLPDLLFARNNKTINIMTGFTKYLIIISLLLYAINAQSQILISLVFGDKLNSPNIEFGLEGGINLSKVSKFESKTMLPTFGLGFYFDIKLKNKISLSTGVLVKSTFVINKLKENDLIALDAMQYDISGNYRLRLRYFMVPILIRFTFKNYFYIEAGPQVGLMYRSDVEYYSNIDNTDARIRNYNRDKINKIDVGAMVGFGYKLRKGTGMTIGIKYYYGFVDVVKSISGTKNSSLFIKLNIPSRKRKV